MLPLNAQAAQVTDAVVSPQRRTTGETLAWLASAAVALWVPIQRWAFIRHEHPPHEFVYSDMQGYVERAWHLGDPASTLSRYDTFYPPGTHVVMAPLMRLGGTQQEGLLLNEVLWWALATGTVWLLGAVAYRLFRHPAAVGLSMALLMAHMTFTVFTGLFMSENPFSFFMMLSLLMGFWARDTDPAQGLRRTLLFALAGLVAGVGATVRPQFVFGAATLGLPLLHRGFPWVRVREALVLALMFALPCLGAMALNRRAAGVPVGMSGNAGFNFYQGHCDVVHVETHPPGGGGGYYAFAAPVRIQRVQRERREEKRAVFKDHMAWENDFFFAEGLRCIRDDGWAHLRRVATNVEDLFSPADPWPPNATRFARASNQANHVVSHLLLLMLPAVLVLARFRRAERWLLLQFLTLMPVGFIFYGDSRYRIPYDMFGILMLVGMVLAVLGLRRDGRVVPGVGHVGP